MNLRGWYWSDVSGCCHPRYHIGSLLPSRPGLQGNPAGYCAHHNPAGSWRRRGCGGGWLPSGLLTDQVGGLLSAAAAVICPSIYFWTASFTKPVIMA